MSKTIFIEYRDHGFWAYDVAIGVLLKHLIDRANQYVGQDTTEWLRDCIENWRVNAVISDFGLYLDPAWTEKQLKVIRMLIGATCRELETVDAISAEEASSWKILDGQGICARGAAQIATAPITELGRAIEALLGGTLPSAPPGTWWCYGGEKGRCTIQRNG